MNCKITFQILTISRNYRLQKSTYARESITPFKLFVPDILIEQDFLFVVVYHGSPFAVKFTEDQHRMCFIAYLNCIEEDKIRTFVVTPYSAYNYNI